MNWNPNIIKISMFLILIYRSDVFLIKIPTACVLKTDKLILRFLGKNKGPEDSQVIFEDEKGKASTLAEMKT